MFSGTSQVCLKLRHLVASSSDPQFDFVEAENESETNDSDEIDVNAQADGHANAVVWTPVSMILWEVLSF